MKEFKKAKAGKRCAIKFNFNLIYGEWILEKINDFSIFKNWFRYNKNNFLKKSLTLIIIFLFCIGCKSRINNLVSNPKFSKTEKDSILNIVNNLCGYWEIEDEQKYSSKSIYLGRISIECAFGIDKNELLNQIYISKSLTLTEENITIPNSAKNLLLPVSDSVTISKKGKYFGFKYHEYMSNIFIPIKILNDSILKLTDGRKYIRIE